VVFSATLYFMIMLIIIVILGLCAGSFALAMTLRMYDGRDWVRGRSECDICHKPLKLIDLVPLFSWLSTKGTCRYCHKKIGGLLPLVELSTALVFGISYYFWPYGFTKMGIALLSVWLVMLTIMVSLTIFDLKWYILPDKLVYTLVGLATGSKVVQILYTQSFERIPGILIGLAVGSGIFYLLHTVSKGKYIGGGDVKYGLFFGMLLASGFKSMLVISIASVIGTLIILPSMLSQKRKLTSVIPFGPSLILATFIMYVFGDRIAQLLMTTYLFP